MKLRLSFNAFTTSTAALTAFALTAFGCSISSDDYVPAPDESMTPEAPNDEGTPPEDAERDSPGDESAAEPSAPPPQNEPADVAMMGSELGAPSAGETLPDPVLAPPPESTDPAATAGGAGDPPEEAGTPEPEPEPEPVRSPTLFTRGRQLLDTCGAPFVVRGVEQIFAEQLPRGNDWSGLIEQIVASGVNAVRVLANTDTLDLSDVDILLDVLGERGLVAYVTPYGGEATGWLGRPEVQSMLAEHENHIIIDAFGEPTFDDRGRFVSDSTRALRQVREWGYRVPLTVTANQFGRDLPSILELGAEIIAADPLQNTILGWQAYWSSSGYYQERYGFSLSEAVEAVAAAPFPIQLGLDHVTDFPSSDTADYGTLLSGAQTHGIGWLWWDWFNPYGRENNLTEDGSATRLTPTGAMVINDHAASVRKTSRLPCAPAE